MKTILLMAFQFAGPVLVGLSITHYLRAVTVRLLTDVCGTADRAEFWARIAAVLMVCMPLALVLVVATSPMRCMASDVVCEDVVVRQTFLATLLGSLVSVASVALVIGRYLPRARTAGEVQPAVEAT
jgi:uncharacterized membrane protein YhaH (DUF805 family)